MQSLKALSPSDLQPLISQERIVALIKDSAFDICAELLPHPDMKKLVMRIFCIETNLNAYLAMASKAEIRTFSSSDGAWKLTVKLGISGMDIDNDKFYKFFESAA
ncbi:hypothetical protein [Pseudoalteromonas sp. GutCa3]|uniref:hypothetical protein n=1 Tax=Pseudoalteromonas sp. GutCa3 TaxID=888433 RepID=UPI000C31E9E7|nr:hypothetical protein [Pseudoalteromonas sp. GutCa3]PKG68588.1 hypothetical protein CXF64_19905 [Pseudoalteromonas sp. GutCa3]